MVWLCVSRGSCIARGSEPRAPALFYAAAQYSTPELSVLCCCSVFNVVALHFTVSVEQSLPCMGMNLRVRVGGEQPNKLFITIFVVVDNRVPEDTWGRYAGNVALPYPGYGLSPTKESRAPTLCAAAPRLRCSRPSVRPSVTDHVTVHIRLRIIAQRLALHLTGGVRRGFISFTFPLIHCVAPVNSFSICNFQCSSQDGHNIFG